MLSKLQLLAATCLLTIASAAQAQTITTIAGGGSTKLDPLSRGTYAYLNGPQAITADSSTGTVYFTDWGNMGGVVYKITGDFYISLIAGTGEKGYSGDGDAATSATFSQWIGGIAVDPNTKNIYVSDTYNAVIRKINASTGNISTFVSGLSCPMGLAHDGTYLYIVDDCKDRVYKANSNGTLYYYAGNGTQGYSGDGGSPTSAEFLNPWAIALDASGNAYITDIGLNGSQCNVRKITKSTGLISHFAGNGYCGYAQDGGAASAAEIGQVKGIAVDTSGNVYLSDSTADRIREVSSLGVISTVAGNGNEGFSGDGSSATSAKLDTPMGVAVTSSAFYIADEANGRIREVK